MIPQGARRLLTVMAAASLAIVGCTTGGASPSPTTGGASPSPTAGGGGATTVAVTLQEWAVVPAADSAPAGDITFDVTNKGPADVHEFVVIKTDLDAADLPTDADGVVEEAGGGMDVIDQTEDVPAGETQALTVTLAAGSYVLVCNIMGFEAHYQMGMRTVFTVTE